MKLIKLFFLSLIAMVLTACGGGGGSGLPSQGGGNSGTVVSLQVTPATSTIAVDFSQQYIAEALLDNGTVINVTENPTVSWSSSDPAIATINNKGLATGVALGTVTIMASGTANGQPFSATAELTVTNAVVTRLQIAPDTASVPVGLEQQYTATAFLSDGTSLDVTNNAALSWSSSNNGVAIISSTGTSGKGLATGVTPGPVTITASGTANGQPFSATAELTVTNAVVTRLQIAPDTASVPVGLEQQYTATALLSDGTSLDVTNNAALNWSSSDNGVATISSTGTTGKGLATGVKPGTVTITAFGTANGQPFSATTGLTVTNAVVTRLQIAPDSASVPVGLEQQYTATAFLSDGASLDVTNNAAISWSSSDTDIATISSVASGKGLATGSALGTVTITASGTANGQPFSATTDLTVTNAVLTGVWANGYTFVVNAGFPSTGFNRAAFTLQVSSGRAGDYTWSSNADWVDVDSAGIVHFTSKGNASPVTITGVPTAGGNPLIYTFTVKSWFTTRIDTNYPFSMYWRDAELWCSSTTVNGHLTTVAEFTKGTDVRDIGSLWSEWGRLSTYISEMSQVIYYWTSDIQDYYNVYNVSMWDGSTSATFNGDQRPAICSEPL